MSNPLDELRTAIANAMNKADMVDVLTIIMEAQEQISRIVAKQHGHNLRGESLQ